MTEKQTEKIIVTALLATLVIVAVVFLSMMTMMGGHFLETRGMMGPMMGWNQTGYWRWIPISGAVFFVVLIVGLYLILSSLKRPETVSINAVQILKERYAKGELTSEQYRNMKKELEN